MKRILLLSICMVMFWTGQAASQTSLSGGVGYGAASSMAYYLTLKQAFAPLYSTESSALTPTLELSGHVWAHSDDRVYGMTLAPGLRYDFNTDGFLRPYLGYTLGGTLVSEEELNGRDFGGHVLVLNRGALGLGFGESIRQRLEVSYSYYSNLGLASPNDGYSVWGASYGLDF